MCKKASHVPAPCNFDIEYTDSFLGWLILNLISKDKLSISKTVTKVKSKINSIIVTEERKH